MQTTNRRETPNEELIFPKLDPNTFAAAWGMTLKEAAPYLGVEAESAKKYGFSPHANHKRRAQRPSMELAALRSLTWLEFNGTPTRPELLPKEYFDPSYRQKFLRLD